MLRIYSDKEFYKIISPILRNSEFQRRRTFLHHQDSVYDHCLRVSYRAYKISCFLSKIRVENAVIAGLLHDFYLEPWRDRKCKNFFKMHGFVHGGISKWNSYQFFPEYMNSRIANSIHRHMFPLTIIPPRYLEGWVVTLADKIVSLEVFSHPKELPKYLGFNLEVWSYYPKKIYVCTKRLFLTVTRPDKI